MSALSNVLDDFFRTEKTTQKAFADDLNLDATTLNKVTKGARAGVELASKVIRGLPEQYRQQALSAWLTDQTPPDLRSLVCIAPNDAVMREDSPQLPEALSADLRRAIIWLAEQAQIHVELRDLVMNLFRSLARPGGIPRPDFSFAVRGGGAKLTREERIERALAKLREAAERDDLSLLALEDQIAAEFPEEGK